MAGDPLTAGIGLVTSVIDKIFPDKDEANKAKLEVFKLQASGEMAVLTASASIIQTEANSEHFLTATWRPITMLTFVALIAAHWMGFTAPNLSQEEILALLDIVKIGLGGFVLSRSAEKTMKAYKS